MQLFIRLGTISRVVAPHLHPSIIRGGDLEIRRFKLPWVRVVRTVHVNDFWRIVYRKRDKSLFKVLVTDCEECWFSLTSVYCNHVIKAADPDVETILNRIFYVISERNFLLQENVLQILKVKNYQTWVFKDQTFFFCLCDTFCWGFYCFVIEVIIHNYQLPLILVFTPVYLRKMDFSDFEFRGTEISWVYEIRKLSVRPLLWLIFNFVGLFSVKSQRDNFHDVFSTLVRFAICSRRCFVGNCKVKRVTEHFEGRIKFLGSLDRAGVDLDWFSELELVKGWNKCIPIDH